MTIRVFGRLRQVLAADSIELEAATVGEALDVLRAKLDRGDAEGHGMLDKAVILVNGRNIQALAGRETALNASDQVTVLQQIAGG
ncbi:MAG: MoaD/ThiS family protein [Armatimonadota bacterium]|nr:MAG: MoaD/ThiS family protein [Armatimonadota bacterium]